MLEQDCRFQRLVSYLHVACDPLIAERNYPALSIIKYNFLMFIKIVVLLIYVYEICYRWYMRIIRTSHRYNCYVFR